MRKAVRRFIFILLGSLLLVLPAAAQGGQEKADAFYLEGVRQQLKGNYSEAFELFRHALEINPDLVGALYELSNYGHYMRNDSMATALVEQASAIDADNYWLKQALVQLYVDQKREEDNQQNRNQGFLHKQHLWLPTQMNMSDIIICSKLQ